MKKGSTKKGEKKTEIVKAGKSLSLSSFDATAFEQALQTEKVKNDLLQKYISEQLREGIDYGKIKMKGKSGQEYESKPTLYKAGSEKFGNLLKLKPIFFPDNETRAMLPQSVIDAGVITYICRLVPIHRLDGLFTKDELKKMMKEKDKPFEDVVRVLQVAEGRGACALSEKNGNVNVAIKITEKRAQTDAVLRIGLSDTFTQDLEDLPESNGNGGSKPACKRPEPDDVVTFGKHKDKKWKDLPLSYLSWLRDNSDDQIKKDGITRMIAIIQKSKSGKKEEPKKENPKTEAKIKEEVILRILDLLKKLGCHTTKDAVILAEVNALNELKSFTLFKLDGLEKKLVAKLKEDTEKEENFPEDKGWEYLKRWLPR